MGGNYIEMRNAECQGSINAQWPKLNGQSMINAQCNPQCPIGMLNARLSFRLTH
jgi:hypothetical protein